MTTYYEKQGRRYIPVCEYDTTGALPLGTHLVSVQPGLQRWQYHVQPDRAAVEVAMLEAQEAMETALHQAMLLRPERQNTERERRAWEAYCKAYGSAPLYLRCEGIAPRTIAEVGIAALRERMP